MRSPVSGSGVTTGASPKSTLAGEMPTLTRSSIAMFDWAHTIAQSKSSQYLTPKDCSSEIAFSTALIDSCSESGSLAQEQMLGSCAGEQVLS
jgi:hypothetical protein